jgi:hypothetical protein
MVKRFNASTWDGKPEYEMEAISAQAAAEQACGGPLLPTGTPLNMCAQVWPVGWADKSNYFYRLPIRDASS